MLTEDLLKVVSRSSVRRHFSVHSYNSLFMGRSIRKRSLCVKHTMPAKINVSTFLRMKDLWVTKRKLHFPHTVVGGSTCKLMTTWQIAYIYSIRFYYNIQTQYLKISAFQFFPSIAKTFSLNLNSWHTIYRQFGYKEKLSVPRMCK